jgi:hypothetical protein
MKQCNKCKQILDESSFYLRHRSGKIDGYVPECIKCLRSRIEDRHKKHKQILLSKFGGSCMRCGYNKTTSALCFHHLDPLTKSFTIFYETSRKIEELLKESEKCILLCANCHAEIHAGLWTYNSANPLGIEPRMED